MAARLGRRAFIFDSAAVLLGRVTSTGALALVAILTARSLGPEGRGELTILLTVLSLIPLLAAFGVNFAGRVLVPEGRVRLGDYLGLVPSLVAFGTVLSAAVAAVAFPVAGFALGPTLLLVSAAYGGVATAAYLLLEGLYIQGRFRTAAWLDGMGSIVSLVATVAALVFTSSPVWLVAAVGAGLLVEVIAAGATLRAEATFRSREAARILARTGVPAMGFTIGQIGAIRGDRYIVGVLLDPAALGLYSVAATATELLRLIPNAVSVVLFQHVAESGRATDQARRVRLLGLAGMAAVAVLVGAVGGPLIRVVFGDDYAGALGPLRILLVAELALASYMFDVAVVSGRQRFAAASVVSLAGFAAVVLADYALVPPFELPGAAVASCLAYGVMAMGARLAARRVTGSEPGGA